MTDYVFLRGGHVIFFEVIYLLTQQTQIVSGMMILDVSDLSKTNQAIFEVIELLKSNIYALDLEELVDVPYFLSAFQILVFFNILCSSICRSRGAS